MKRMAALLATAAAISAVVPATAGAATSNAKCGPILMLIPLCK
jgi:hypothetical protein